jgi:hypothetical protein
MASILIIDRELGFMWALAERLQTFGIATIPSSSVEEAQALLEVLRPQLELLIINCRCRGACLFAERLRMKYGSLQVVGIVSSGFRCGHCATSFIATLNDPEDRHPDRMAQCAELVHILVDRGQRQ